ncbi:MAG: autotransporter-associated beta strand repeat-containing protein [Prevotella sp.]|nr:autotransporter-associated beta strand repeat-containing protein [Prevotella sp.]
MKTLRLWLSVAAIFLSTIVFAQRPTDQLGRGLVVVPTTSSGDANLISWRQLPDEYYGVTYNLYRNGQTIAKNLTQTSYQDNSGAGSTSRYQVAPVVNGVIGAKSDRMKPWASYIYQLYDNYWASGYLDITLADVYDRDGNNVTTDYSPNDAEMADLDGDGNLELIIKRLNTADAAGYDTGNTDSDGNAIYNIYPASSKAFVVIDAYDVNWQTGDATLMWRIDCGPNMVSLNSTEIDIIAYDWDEDGKAEVVLRGADDMIIHMNDGTTQTIGIEGFNFRESSHFNHLSGSQYAWSHFGREYLIYMNGETGKPYQVTDFPLPRLEESEWKSMTSTVAYNDYVGLANAGYANYFTKSSGAHHKAWGDNYGHRSSKYFFGAPFLDGRKASLFLARGIYTRHKMIALDLDTSTHQWNKRWTWACNNSSSPWYGNGYHNFVVADVDEDGRDEIVYGSMVIDDNGHGLSTTGYQHGDAQHVSDFDPWRKGLEFFGCLEDGPYYGCNYRNATTSEVYYKFTASSDDGRALMANFSNTYPGSLGRSSSSSLMSSATDQLVSALTDDFIPWGDLNSRIYWDGDLCSEILNSPGTAKDAKVDKPGSGRIFTTTGCNMNNDSKNNACFQGDIIGDWREEFIVRHDTNVRVYISGTPTDYSFPSLWFDHQYRQAMVWQMMAYNQPPHLSYFLGEMEGYTVAPPPLTNTGRTIVSNGSSIGQSMNDQHVMACETNDMTINVETGASPSVFTDNAPSWVQGTDVNGTSGTKVKSNGSIGVSNLPTINTTYYTHTVTGAAFTGDMSLCKQGDGTLILPDVEQTYTGTTTVWAGTLQFNSQLTNSPLTLKRFATLNTNGGTFQQGIDMEYGATLNIGGAQQGTIGTVSTSTLNLGYGSRIVFDINGKGDDEHDWLNATTIAFDTDKATDDIWTTYGPDNLTPVLVLNVTTTLSEGTYPLANVETISGDLSKVKVVSLTDEIPALESAELVHANGVLALKLGSMPELAKPEISISGMLPYGDYYLPVVNINTDNSDVTPTTEATFTALDGTISAISNGEDESLYSHDYEQDTSIDGWTTPGANISLGNDNAHGNYFLIDTQGTNTRYAYTTIDDIDFSTTSNYTVEFDLALTASNKEASEFCVMTKDGTMASNNWDNYASINGSSNMLLDITGGANNTSYTINGTTSVDITNDTWYHVALSIDQVERTVEWTMTPTSGSALSGTFAIPDGSSTEFAGFYVVAARYYSVIKLDNIQLKALLSQLQHFTFTEPGTLTITASANGYSSTTTTFEVLKPFEKTYESTDFSTIQASEASTVLGSMWNTETFTSRWASWSTSNATYGSQYVMVKNTNNTYGQPIYVDSEGKIYATYIGSAYPLTLVQDFGIGQNKAATFNADALGTANTWFMVRSDVSLGKNVSTTNFVQANENGGFSFKLANNGTLQQIVAYTPLGEASQSDVATTIETLNGDEGKLLIYDLSGRYRGSSTQSLPSGIYILRSEKTNTPIRKLIIK